MRKREYKWCMKKKIRKYQDKYPDMKYVINYFDNKHLFTLKNIRWYLKEELYR